MQRNLMKKGVWGLLLVILASSVLWLGQPAQVAADTIGDVLDNTGTTVPKDKNGQPWNMYQVPGLTNNQGVSRDHGMNEGSFVRSGTAASGAPLSTTPDSSGTGYQDMDSTTNSPQAESPADIQFQDSDDGTHGNPWFVINYVNKLGFVDYGNADIANNFSKSSTPFDTDANHYLYNPDGVQSKMDGNTGKLKDGESFNGGYLQISGNVPIRARIATTPTTINAIMAGNWGVMVRVDLPKGVNAKDLASTVAWNSSYFYLTLDTYTFNIDYNFLFIPIKIPITFKNLTFPLQFDHHIYLDKNNPDGNDFYLKVKGIPFSYNIPSDGSSAQMQLQKPKSDALDYLHNRYYDGGQMEPLDNLDSDSDNSLDLNGQPEFQTQGTGRGMPWDAWYGIAHELVIDPLQGQGLLGQFASWAASVILTTLVPESPVYKTGLTGRTLAMLNGVTKMQSADRKTTNGNILGALNSIIVAPIINNLASYFTQNYFKGTAHINFTFDISKYADHSSADREALTSGKLFAAPYSDGKINDGDGLQSGDRRGFGITMFNTAQLVDPYRVLTGSNTMDSNSASSNDAIFQHLKAGVTPIDYALVKTGEKGTPYPVYTNFTSWTGAITPYDRLHWADDSSKPLPKIATDTLHSQDKLASDLNSRSATPDPAKDGILVNDGKAFPVQDQTTFYNQEQAYQPVFNKDKFTTAGVIRPQRYANVYQLYDYSKSTPTPLETPKAVYDGVDNNKVSVTANDGVNFDGTTINSALNNSQWHYTGTLNTLPLADATLGLNQSLKPTIDLSDYFPIYVNRSEITGGKSQTKPVGYFRDPLATGTNASNLHLGFSTKQTQQDAWNKTGEGVTYSPTPKLLSGNFSSKNDVALDQNQNMANNTAMSFNSDGSAVGKFQVPLQSDPTSILYYGYADVDRDNTKVNIVNSYKLGANVDNTASDDTMLVIDDNTPDKDWYTIKKQFSDGSLVHFVQSGDTGKDVGVTTEGISNQLGGKNYGKDVTLMIPIVPGADIDGTPQVTTSDSGNSLTSGPTKVSSGNGDIDKKYASYQVSFASPPEEFKFTYQYKITDPTQLPYQRSLQDLAVNGTQALGVSNGISFNEFKNENLVHVPSLDFGKHQTPSATGTNAPYSLTDPQDAYFQVQDNTNHIGSWTLYGAMGPFTSADHNTQYTDFRTSLGVPGTDVKGTGESGVTPVDVTGAFDPAWDYSQMRYFNHYPHDMISNNQQTKLYELNRLQGDVDNTENPLTRYYPKAGLTVPAETITNGKYTSTITYLLSDNGSL
ncbi:hypothetical protein LH991_10290 [Schleiferilactobacillus harbinensis]|uniref:Uncharacterized protein n=2 Tax=Schleiferilactobacillus harbinensis TaxID=304207 RepID=A0A5P2TQK9_9LACO|nr:hypothetical protein [Schleiferilactobacillus harbinensis]KRM29240.1 hypothetical protein FC91_GL000817 [Schleiferilactobacillus harbinensis DSM 16991]QEU46012.1 hypothetical protein FMM01_01075 [Schleiferilactobacillus harbinensis]QFR22820.1 hypothetical protein D1010_04835 [Schleiferilactobacillus harbinensis]QFR64332.1 hypothetical protein LH991_10290 [Schleiferilactobacillus harbinensis]